MKTKPTFYFDMDGVLCDWFGSASRLHGRTPEEIEVLKQTWPEGETHSENVLGIPTADFWRELQKDGHHFWANLIELDGAREIWDHAGNLGAIRRILSCPSIDPFSMSGKGEWMQRFTNDKWFRDVHLTPHKHECADIGRILIDDHEKNVDDFIAAGGLAILYPQPWNRNRAKSKEAVHFVLSEMTAMASFLASIEVEIPETGGKLGSG